MQIQYNKLSEVEQDISSKIEQSIADIRFNILCGEFKSAMIIATKANQHLNSLFEVHKTNNHASDEFKTISMIAACAYSDMTNGIDTSLYMSGNAFDQDGQDLAYWKAEFEAKKSAQRATKLETNISNFVANKSVSFNTPKKLSVSNFVTVENDNMRDVSKGINNVKKNEISERKQRYLVDSSSKKSDAPLLCDNFTNIHPITAHFTINNHHTLQTTNNTTNDNTKNSEIAPQPQPKTTINTWGMFGSYADELSEQENKLLQAQAISALSPFERARFKPAYKSVEKPRSEISQLIIDNLADPYKVRWRNVTDDQKLALSFIETEARGGYSFRLTFSNERAKRLLAVTDPCQTFSRDFLDREFKKEFHETLPYSFRFEFSNKGVLHIHGAIIVDQQLNNIEARLRMVLNKAGGVTGLSSQSKVIRLYDALGYFSYLEKSTTATVKKMPSNEHDITRVNDKIRDIISNNHKTYRNTK